MPTVTALYRFYDADDELLYVGISLNLPGRLHQHQKSKTWWKDVAHVAVEHFDSREEALAAEEEAIKTERPLMNVVHNTPRGAQAPAEELFIICEGCGRPVGRTEHGYPRDEAERPSGAQAPAPGPLVGWALPDLERRGPPAGARRPGALAWLARRLRPRSERRLEETDWLDTVARLSGVLRKASDIVRNDTEVSA